MTTKTREKNHAISNAEGHAETIIELYKAAKALEDGAAAAEADGCEFTDADEVREHAQEEALSVEVRSGWHTPGCDESKAEEFCILLTTGGPALRIIGELNEYGEADPDASRMEWQDWGTPWTEYRHETDLTEDWEAAFAWFLGCFYFGE